MAIARLLVAHAIVVAVMLCVARADVSSTTPTSPTPGTVVDSSGCPVEDETFCEVATEAANALAAGDDEALLRLSRVDTIVCDDVTREYFPECEPSAVLHGYGLSDPHFLMSETPAYVGRAVAALAADPDVARWSGQALTSWQLAQGYDFTDADGSRPDWGRYFAEVVAPTL